MPAFDTVECENCGSEFRAVPGAIAATAEYSSPACVTAGKGLA